MRLPAILVSMLLLLLSGVVSVRVLETTLGGATVPGLVLLDAAGLDHAGLLRIQERHPGSALESVPADDAPLAPFGSPLILRLATRGDALALYSLVPLDVEPLSGSPWIKRRTNFPRPEPNALVDEAAGFLASQHGTQAYFLALVLASETAIAGIDPVRTLVHAAETLPSFRRTSLVVLGARRRDQPGQRWALRVDVGRWPREPDPGLKDLLSARW